MRFTVGNYTTTLQRLEVGIVTGCTISVILFAAAMNLIVKYASGVQQPSTRAFMNGMTITANAVIEGRWMMEDLEFLINSARKQFKPDKYRDVVLKKGKIQH